MLPETSRRDLAAALEESAELLERIGGRHREAARFIRRHLETSTAARLVHRDRALVDLRLQWFLPLSENAAAGEMAKVLSRYAVSAWKRRDRAFSEPPPSYSGTFNEALFRIVALSLGDPPGKPAIRKILAAAGVDKIRPLESSKAFALVSAAEMRSPVFVDHQALAVVKSLPEYRAAEARASEERLEQRRRHVAAIEQIDQDSTKAWSRDEKRKAAAVAKMRQAELDLKTAGNELSAVVSAIGAERLARETARRNHEIALCSGDWPEIDAFEAECQGELRIDQARIVIWPIVNHNVITGRKTTGVASNAGSVARRRQAVLETLRALPELKLLADPREIPARIAAMRANWPEIEDISSPDAPTPRGKAKGRSA